MTRIILLSLLNFALPFLLRWLWLTFIDWQRTKPKEKRIIDVTPKKGAARYPKPLLIGIGLALFALTLITWRILDNNTDTQPDWQPANPAQTINK